MLDTISELQAEVKSSLLRLDMNPKLIELILIMTQAAYNLGEVNGIKQASKDFNRAVAKAFK